MDQRMLICLWMFHELNAWQSTYAMGEAVAYNVQPGDIVQITNYCQAGDQVAVNVFNYLVSSITGGGPDLAACAGTFGDVVKDFYRACMGATASWLGTKASVYGANPQPMPGFYANHGVGTGSGDLLPRATCGLIQWQTDYTGKSYRGRTYVPFPCEGLSGSDGEPTAGYLTAIDNLASAIITLNEFVSEFATATIALIINSRHLNTFSAVRTASFPQKWATQHRRGDYGRIFVSPV